jgi:ATP-dependent helicase/nuclease subunit B
VSLLVENLAGFCRAHPLEEKILVAPTHLVGQEIVAAVAIGGQPVFNLHVETVKSLATGIVAEELAREKIRVLSRAEELALIEDACTGAESYFGGIREHPGFHQAVALTIREFSEAGLDLAAIRLPENEVKARDLSQIGYRYRESLERHRALDRAGLLRRAIRIARPGKAFVLVPNHPNLADDERLLVEAVSGGRKHGIPTDEPEDWPLRAKDFVLARASSAEEEVRRVLRRLASESAALDQAELVYVPAEALPMIFELSRELGLPATFAEGIPLGYTRPGRAAIGLLRWLDRDFEAETLASLAEAGVLGVERSEKPVSGREMARELRAAGIGWGRDRYARCLTSSSPIREWAESLLAESAGFELRGMISPSALGKSLAGLLKSSVAVKDDWDAAGAETLARLLPEIAGIERPPRSASDAVALVREILEDTATASAGPRPGSLHVASVSSAGYSGRARTFIVGLDADHFPGRIREDPLLSDREREAINLGRAPGLRLRGDRNRERREDFEAMLSRLRGRVEISYPSHDPVENSEKFPSPFLLDVLRARPGQETPDYRALEAALKAQAEAGNLPAPLSEGDWWLEEVRAGNLEPAEVRGKVGAILPLVGEGLTAESRRKEDAFTEFDGRVSSFRGRFDPRGGRGISASSIEKFARCPYRWFLEEGLGVKSPAVLERDEEVWLDEKTFGSAAHEVLRDFVAALEERRPSLADAARLKALAMANLDARKSELPPPTEGAERRVRRRMERLCDEFLRLEGTLPAEERAIGFEVELSEPVAIALGDGASFPLTGRIDRVDMASDGSRIVFDYKTGRRPPRAEKEGLAAGRRIQPALYALALESRRPKDGVSPPVSSARYYHLAPGAGGFIENLGRSGRSELLEILSALFDAMATGSFLHSREFSQCAHCDFTAVCGGKRASQRAGRLLDRDPTEEDPLEPFRRLKGWVRKRRGA